MQLGRLVVTVKMERQGSTKKLQFAQSFFASIAQNHGSLTALINQSQIILKCLH